MSPSKPTINPYYSKWDSPKPQNRFQRAVFNGRAEKVEHLIASGENVYVTTDLDESPLFLSIVRDQPSIVDQILDIYEEDLEFVRQFFKEKHNTDWTTQRPVFVAHGKDNIRSVNELSAGMEVLFDHCCFNDNTIVILLKSSQEKQVLALRPNSHEDNVKIAKVIEYIWNDGVIDLHHRGHWGRTVFDVAALRNQPEVYCRLIKLSNVEQEKLVEHILQMCRHSQEDQVDFFKNICTKTGLQFNQIGDIISTKHFDLLALPAYYDLFEMFVLFMESLADRVETTSESREVVMRNILSSYKVKTGSSIMETIIWADNQDFVERCFVYFQPNLLLMGANKESILQTLIAQPSSEYMIKFVVDHFDQVLNNGIDAQIVMQLIERNWLDAVKTLYDRYESTRRILFRNKKQGVQCLLNAIDGCRYHLANYIVEIHQDELTDPDDVTQLILYCSFVQRSNTVLQTLLNLPAADVLRTSGPEHYYKSPIYVALKFHHLNNYRLLLDNVNNLQGLHDLKEDCNGENLLFPAIWFKENPVDEKPFVYVEEEQASLEVVDSSDDEDDTLRKKARNEQIMTSTGPYKDPIMPDSYFKKESNEMKQIFDYYLNELCLDYRCVNNEGETLVHVAVKRDSYDAVKQLLGLGLDPNAKDVIGNCPIHFARSTVIFNMLRDYKCDINIVNDAGETPLMSYVKSIVTDEDQEEESRELFLEELLRAGADINHTDAIGLTVLHVVKNVKIAQILLQNGAPINMKNNEGETPILYIFREQVEAYQKLCKVFLCDERLDMMAISNNNVSILSVLVSLDNATMADVLTTFSNHSKTYELENVFIQHCNSVDHSGCPVLITACSEFTNSYCLEKLLNLSQLNPNIHTEHYQPLEAESSVTVKRLIDRGANVNGFGVDNRKTPLMHAIGGRNLGGYKSNFEIFSILLAAGADVSVTDANGDSALDYACRLENLKDARRTIAALILANVNYRQQSYKDDSQLIKVMPFQSLFLG